MATPTPLEIPSSPFPTILNFRDVGQTINDVLGIPFLRENFFFRSARPDEASVDRAALKKTFNIKTILDLRSKTEHINQSKKRDAAFRGSSFADSSIDAAAEPFKIAGIRYEEINLNGGAFERALLWKLKWSSMTKLLSLMVMGYRTEAIAVLGREVMAPRGLIGLGVDSLTYSRREIYQIFSLLSQDDRYPILIHCTQGKDRTGLVVILVLLLCGVPADAITKDYMASETELEPEKEVRMREIEGMGLGREFARCPPGFVQEVVKWLGENGGVEGYLDSCEVDEGMRSRIRDKLLREKLEE